MKKPKQKTTASTRNTTAEKWEIEAPTKGPCAKKKVICTLITPSGERFVGTNDCARPQPRCPRLAGEGYAKCKGICRQPGHAEDIALKAAGDKAAGATAYLEGIDHYCKDCQHKLIAAGVSILKFGAPL